MMIELLFFVVAGLLFLFGYVMRRTPELPREYYSPRRRRHSDPLPGKVHNS